MHMYVPWWKFDRKNDFLRGYHIEVGGGRNMPGVGEFDGVCEEFEGYGAPLNKSAAALTARLSDLPGAER